MNRPTQNDVQTAIRVLRQLRQRIHRSADRTAANLTKNSFGTRHAAQIEQQALAQLHVIDSVLIQLNFWNREGPDNPAKEEQS
jgi:hypothetical protein